MNHVNVDVPEQEITERQKISAGSETSRRNENHLPIIFKEFGTDSHK